MNQPNPLVGTGIGALDRLIGNVSDTWGSGAALRHQLQTEEVGQRAQLNRVDIMSRVEAAKAAGLHPTMALGTNVAGSAGFPISNPIDSSSARRSISEARLFSKQEQLVDAQTLESKSRALINLEEAKLMADRRLATQAGQPPMNSGDVIVEPVRLSASRDKGTMTAGKGPANSQVLVKMPDGSVGVQTMFGSQQEDEISQYVNLISRTTGIDPKTVELMAAVGLLAVPAGLVARGGFMAYKSYRAAQAAKAAQKMQFKPFRKGK